MIAPLTDQRLDASPRPCHKPLADLVYSIYSMCAKLRPATRTSVRHSPLHHPQLPTVRLIFCDPTPRPHAQTAMPFGAPYSVLSTDATSRASNPMPVSACVDQQKRHTSSCRSACMTDEALHCRPASQPHVIIARSVRVAGLLLLTRPTALIKCHFRIFVRPYQPMFAAGPVAHSHRCDNE